MKFKEDLAGKLMRVVRESKVLEKSIRSLLRDLPGKTKWVGPTDDRCRIIDDPYHPERESFMRFTMDEKQARSFPCLSELERKEIMKKHELRIGMQILEAQRELKKKNAIQVAKELKKVSAACRPRYIRESSVTTGQRRNGTKESSKSSKKEKSSSSREA